MNRFHGIRVDEEKKKRLELVSRFIVLVCSSVLGTLIHDLQIYLWLGDSSKWTMQNVAAVSNVSQSF